MEEFDFGFSLVDGDDLTVVTEAVAASETATLAASETQLDLEETDEKLNNLYNAIQPLLRNLCENPEKEYILWPNRVEKVSAFKDMLDQIYMGG